MLVFSCPIGSYHRRDPVYYLFVPRLVRHPITGLGFEQGFNFHSNIIRGWHEALRSANDVSCQDQVVLCCFADFLYKSSTLCLLQVFVDVIS